MLDASSNLEKRPPGVAWCRVEDPGPKVLVCRSAGRNEDKGPQWEKRLLSIVAV